MASSRGNSSTHACGITLALSFVSIMSRPEVVTYNIIRDEDTKGDAR
jgi:hypothetical protein